MNCPFCKFDPKINPILKQSKYFNVIPSNPILMFGHVLVIPKRHIEKVSELNLEEQKELFELIIEFEEKILKFASGCDIRQNYRPFIKSSHFKVNHLHFHLQPRNNEDKLYKHLQMYKKDVFKDLNQEEIDEVVKVFSKN